MRANLTCRSPFRSCAGGRPVRSCKVFQTGGAIVGRFLYDTDADIINSYSFTTTPNFPNTTVYDSDITNGFAQFSNGIDFAAVGQQGRVRIHVAPSALDAGPGTIQLNGGNGGFFECPSVNVCNPFRDGTGTGFLSGSVVLVADGVIPLLASAWLLGAGVAGLMGVRRRRRA